MAKQKKGGLVTIGGMKWLWVLLLLSIVAWSLWYVAVYNHLASDPILNPIARALIGEFSLPWRP